MTCAKRRLVCLFLTTLGYGPALLSTPARQVSM